MVDDIRLQYQMGKRSVLAVLSTGGGKTRIFSHIADAASRKGNRVLILVHRAELLDQASRSLPMHHGIIAANRAMDLSHAVQVASVQTVARRLHRLPRDMFQLIVVDEAHHTTAGTWARTLEHFNSAKLLGVTATPIRGDGRGLGEHYQAMVEGPSAQWLTDNGYLAAARVLAPPGFSAAGMRKRMGDFDQRDAEQQVRAIHGDCVSHYRQHLSGQTAIAFCCSVAHAEAVAALFLQAGIPAASIDGSMDAVTRRHLLKQLGANKIKVLTSCALIGEGVDVPSVGGCILLRPTASVGLHLQMIGRCLRPSGSKVAVVLDHVGNCLRLGHHLEPREWTLEGLKKQDREKAPSVKVCPKCYAAMASQARVCGECGHVFAPQETRELKQVDGELVEHKALPPLGPYKKGDIVRDLTLSRNTFVVLGVVPKLKRLMVTNIESDLSVAMGFGVPMNEVEFVSRPSKDHRRQQGTAQSLEDLIALGQRRGYKNPAAWAKYVMYGRSLKGR
jgi:superfamily II DNA or RNA helicase